MEPFPFLTTESAHVWSADIDTHRFSAEELRHLLLADEREHAARFLLEGDRQRSIVGRALLRRLLGLYLGRDPLAVPIRVTAYGKPYLADSNLRFSVSHSGDWVMLAFTLDCEVGIDIERARTGVDLEGVAQACFSDEERHDIFARQDDVVGRFYERWTAKESWMKADGRGFSLPIAEYSLRGDPSGGYRVFHPSGEELNWTTRALRCAPGYRAAITSAGTGWRVLDCSPHHFFGSL